MGKLDGKVALITGAARGQGRSHALTMAGEGADIVAIDACAEFEGSELSYRMATPNDLQATVDDVERLGRRILAVQCDVRDGERLADAVNAAVSTLGRLDTVVANAGIFAFGRKVHEIPEQTWDTVMDINAKGVWQTCRATIPHLTSNGAGGSIVIVSSTAGIRGTPNVGAYAASKHAVVGLMKTMAAELGPFNIRVNSVHPCSVNTVMIQNDGLYKLFRPELEHPALDDVLPTMTAGHLLPVPWVEPEDVSKAVLFLASDDARYITGSELVIDAGYLSR